MISQPGIHGSDNMGVQRQDNQSSFIIMLTVFAICTLSCDAQRLTYIIGQKILQTRNRAASFIVSIDTEQKPTQSFNELVISDNGTIQFPVSNEMYCATNVTSMICKCSLDSYSKHVNVNNLNNDNPVFSTIWELSMDVPYKLNPTDFTQDILKTDVNESKCLHKGISTHIHFCYVDATMTNVELASNTHLYDNFTIFNSDSTFHKRNLCDLPRRQPISYICACEESCHIFAAYNLTVGENLNVSYLNLMINSRQNYSDIYIVFPRQYVGRPKTCTDDKDTRNSGFLLNATSLKTVDFVLSILSLLTLFLTIFFFATCPELRNLHGKNLMSLSVTIFFSQILFLHDVGTLNDKLCSGIGALLHFCWLSIFVWTSSMAFDLARIFGFKFAMNQRRSTNDNKRYVKYAFVAWGCPALVVLICVVVNSDLDNSQQLYGTIVDGGVCMASSNVMIFGLFLPFCISILFNIICFIIIVHGIETNKSKSSRNTRNLEKTRCFIYGKISTLLGLSWIICLVATVEDSRTFWFSFSIMSNLQGVGIFVSFILLNRRVRGVVRRELTSQNTIDATVANVQNVYESLQRDRRASCISDGIMQRENLDRDVTDYSYENPIYAPDEMEDECCKSVAI